MDSKTNNAFSICNTQLLKCMVDLPTFRPLFMVNVYHEPPKPWGFGHLKTRLFTIKTSMGAHGRYKYTKNHWVSVLVTPCRRWKPSTKKTKKKQQTQAIAIGHPIGASGCRIAVPLIWNGFHEKMTHIWGFPKMVGFPNNHGFSY